MDKQEFIANKMKILVGKEGYSRPQAYAISLSMYEKEGHKAQQGTMFSQTLPPQPKYVMPNFNQLPDQGYDFSYNNTFNPQPIENNTSFGQFSASNYEIPTQISSTPQSFSEYNQAQNQVEAENRATNPYTTNSVNILPPTRFGNPAYNLKQGMYNFGRGNTLGGIAGTGASLLGMTRIGLSGYAEGKEDKRVGREYMDKTFDRTQNYQYGQQGGKVKNSDIIAQNAITDNPQQNNVNLEGNEFVMRTSGQVQPVVGDPHIKNGKKADGVDAQLNDGDKVLSNYVKLKPTDIKDVKERYNISVKKGVTFSEVQKELDKKLGIKKLETEKADILERIEKATKIKDVDSKQLSLEVLTKKTGEVNEKLNTLSGVRADNFEFLFQRQEKQEKIGDGTQLFDKNGKEVTESNEEVAQQGRTYRTNDQSYAAQRVSNFLNTEDLSSNTGINLRKIKSIQSGVMNDKLGSGYYMYYDKLPTDAGFDPNRNREFVTEEAYKNTVLRTPAYQEYMRGLSQRPNQLVELQQGGEIETLAKKHGISIQRAQELVSMQQGGVQSQQEETQEGQSSNAQEEQGGVSPEQIVSAFAELSQQDPRQIIAQLQKMSPEEQQQALGQMMQALQQGQQNPQEEEMEVAQQGKYMQLAGKYSEKDQKARLNDFYNMSSGLGYEGKKEIGAMQNWMADNYPDEVVKYFTENGQPLTAKHVDIIKNKYKDAFKETGISANKKSEDYTVEEKLKLQTALGDKASKDFLLEGFKDNKWDWRFPMIGQKPNTSAQGAPQAQITAPSMARFTLPQEPIPTQEAPQTAVEQRQEQAAEPSGVRNILPVYDTFLPPTSALEPIAKNTYSPYLYESKKMTVEPMLAEQARQTATDVERAQQSGLSPQQQEALIGQASAANQMAANDAIYKTETYNADNAWKTDMANVDALNKSQIMNTQYLNDFAQKSAAALANKETERYNNAYSNFLQDQANINKSVNMNYANALNDQFAITPNGIIPLNNKPFGIKNDYLTLENLLKNGTPEEIFAFKKAKGLEASQGSSYNPSTNTEIINNIYGNKAVVAKAKTKK